MFRKKNVKDLTSKELDQVLEEYETHQVYRTRGHAGGTDVLNSKFKMDETLQKSKYCRNRN